MTTLYRSVLIESAAQADALRNNRLDLGVLRTPLPENGLASRTIADEPLVLALPTRRRKQVWA